MSEGKTIDFKIETDCLTNAISFEEAMGITPTVTIDLSDNVAAAKADIEISEQVEYNQEITPFKWDYAPDENIISIGGTQAHNYEIILDESDVSKTIIWKFDILDLMDELRHELHQERIPLEKVAEKTAPKSLINSFENRDPRLGTLSQIKSD